VCHIIDTNTNNISPSTTASALRNLDCVKYKEKERTDSADQSINSKKDESYSHSLQN
jgi:hypothetical protein